VPDAIISFFAYTTYDNFFFGIYINITSILWYINAIYLLRVCKYLLDVIVNYAVLHIAARPAGY